MNENIERRTVLAGLAAAPLALLVPKQSEAAVLMPIIANHGASVANLSISSTTPKITPVAVTPGHAKSGYAFYASNAYVTLYKLGDTGSYRIAPAGKWTWVAASTKIWTVWVQKP